MTKVSSYLPKYVDAYNGYINSLAAAIQNGSYLGSLWKNTDRPCQQVAEKGDLCHNR